MVASPRGGLWDSISTVSVGADRQSPTSLLGRGTNGYCFMVRKRTVGKLEDAVITSSYKRHFYPMQGRFSMHYSHPPSDHWDQEYAVVNKLSTEMPAANILQLEEGQTQKSNQPQVWVIKEIAQ